MDIKSWPKLLFFAVMVKPLVWLLLGVTVHGHGRLPTRGPAILAANHNSHLDTLVIMALFPLSVLPRVRPLAARDYFFRTPLRAALARHLLGAVPVERRLEGRHDPLAEARSALAGGDILLLFPEGSRGEPGELAPLRPGIAHLAAGCPETTVIPLFLRGLERALPRGEALLVPFVCDVRVGKPVPWLGDRHGFMADLKAALAARSAFSPTPSGDERG